MSWGKEWGLRRGEPGGPGRGLRRDGHSRTEELWSCPSLAFTPNSMAMALTRCLLIVHEECLETWEDIFVVTAREWRVLQALVGMARYANYPVISGTGNASSTPRHTPGSLAHLTSSGTRTSLVLCFPDLPSWSFSAFARTPFPLSMPEV